MKIGLTKRISVLLLILSVFARICSCKSIKTNIDVTISPTSINETGELEVHFIDVGQADSILITSDKENILIDAGNNGDGESVVDYIKDMGIEKLDCVIGTHPHEDHIGGMDNVIQSFEIDKFYIPEFEANTATFEDMIDSLIEKDLQITAPVAGEVLYYDGFEMQILTPLAEYDDANNNSIVVKLTHGENVFLFTGDAEAEVEVDLLASGYDLKADVLKVGHHGSDNSTMQEFLDVVKPSYAVISVGEGNKYSHPHDITLEKLNKASAKVYRTDIDGTIIIHSDGIRLEIIKNDVYY